MVDIVGIEAFSDNYIWVVQEANGLAAVIDPGDEDPVIDYLEQSGLEPIAILITHGHVDHVGGVKGLKHRYPGVKVYGPVDEPISDLDIRLGEGDRVVLPDMLFQPVVMAVPGHTKGHIAYHYEDRLFCGDTLFACGCGRVFSGTMGQLHASLSRIGRLSPDTRLYCAHEYTLDNIGFAKWVEPENQVLLAREQQAIQDRQQNLPTVPSLLSLELETNPFLRTDVPAVRQIAQDRAARALEADEAVFTELRQWKDREYD